MQEWIAALGWVEIKPLEQLLAQGGFIMQGLLLVAVLQAWLIIHRWMTWPQLTRHTAQGAHQALLQRHADHLHALIQLEKGLPLLKGLLMVTPLLGLTGSVTGMMLVFDGLSLGAASDPRLLASGIARAILPTFASMAVMLVGMFFLSFWQRRVKRQLQAL